MPVAGRSVSSAPANSGEGEPIQPSLGTAHLALLLLAGMLPVELLILTLTFDGAALAQQSGWWAPLISHAQALPQLLVVVSAALLALYPGRLWESAQRLAQAHREHSRKLIYLAVHLASAGAVYFYSRAVFEPLVVQPQDAALWTLSALATLGFWFFCLAAPGFWVAEAARQRRLLATGALVGAAAWIAAILSASLWEPLANSTFRLSSALLRGFYAHVTANPATRIIGVDDFQVEIAEECSGLEGIGLVAIFLAAYLWFFRDRHRFPASFLLFPLGMAAVWLANAFRIAALVVVGAEFSPAIAVQGFHSQAGWIGFTLVALGAVAVAGRVPVLLKASGRPVTIEGGEASTTPTYLAPVLAVLCATMASGAVAASVDWLYPVRIAAGAVVLWLFRDAYRRFAVVPTWRAVALGVVVFCLWIALEPPAGTAANPLRDGLAAMGPLAATLWLAVRVAGSAVLIPIVEELAFRGYLIRRLASADFERLPLAPVALIPALLSSVAFGLLHGRWVAGTLAGVVYAYALHQRGQLSDAIVAHMVTNALIAAAVLGAGAWGLWL